MNITLSLDVTRRDLETTRQKSDRSFSDYIARWREKVALMRDRPLENEQIEMVIKGALPHFHKQMLFIHYPTFKALHQANIKIKDEEISQPKNPYQKTTKPT